MLTSRDLNIGIGTCAFMLTMFGEAMAGISIKCSVIG